MRTMRARMWRHARMRASMIARRLDPSYFSITGIINATDQHPDHDVVWGEQLVKRIYEALRASPAWCAAAGGPVLRCCAFACMRGLLCACAGTRRC